MAKQKYQGGENDFIVVTECAGDLVVRPWLNLDIQAKGEYVAETIDGVPTFSAHGDLILQVPEQAAIRVETVKGDAVLRSISGDVTIDAVYGDLVVNNLVTVEVGHVRGDVVASNLSGALAIHKIDGDVVSRNLDGDVSLGLVLGDVSARHISGALSCAEISGDANIKSVSGDVLIKRCARDLNLHTVAGRCQAADVAGDIRLLGGLGPYEHELAASGDVVIVWPVDAPLLIEVEAAAIDNRLPLLDLQEEPGKLAGRLGDGKTRMNVKAGGRVVLKEAQIVSEKWQRGPEPVFDFGFDFIGELSELGAKISSEVTEQVAQVTAELESAFGPEFMQRMADQFVQKAEVAAQKAEKAAEKAAQKAEQAAEKAAQKAEQAAERARSAAERKAEQAASAKSAAASSKSAPADSAATEGSDSTEAQLKILKLVEKGVITPDEASVLLDALG